MTADCCQPGLCAFTPLAVAFYRRIRARCLLLGEDPATAAWTLVTIPSEAACVVVSVHRGARFSETPEQRWADLLAEVARAEAAGRATAAEIAAFLCPFGLLTPDS